MEKETELINKFLKNIKPREYQEEILKKCIEKNCLVILPTGVGKTLIALMLVITRMGKFPLEKILFLAPTRPLAQQHFNYFKKHLPELFAQMELFTGKINANERLKLWQKTDIIFSTPQCIGNDLKNKLYDLSDVSLLIEDECHRCVKNYSYTYVAKKYVEESKNQRILGLTASPGADKQTIQTICKNLSIEDVEIRTRESEDVKNYLQEIQFNVIKLEFPDKFKEIRDILKLILSKKIDELKSRKILFGASTKIGLIETQNRIMRSLASGNKNFSLFNGASLCAQAIKIHHAIELIETQTLYTLDNYIKSLFEQSSKNQSKAVKRLTTSPEFNKAYSLVQELVAQNIEHPKLFELMELVEQRIKKNKNSKIIIFSQYRDSVTKICKDLNKLNIPSKTFVGQTKKQNKTKDFSGLSQKEQQKLIDDFSKGDFNVLCATSIGEEGLDIPEVNTVIFYEPVPSAIRKIQRAGRTARLIPGELITLVTKETRDEINYWAAFQKEKRMHKAINSIKEDLKEGKINFQEESSNLKDNLDKSIIETNEKEKQKFLNEFK
ncbi:MAG TPA: helicase-related protein [Candidatus Paceibacterota bacterium]|nr:helicase-related protein [Candidatus Paceibacterota bacterium]